MFIRVTNLEGLLKGAKELIEQIPQGSVVALYGQMGAGKTTLIKAICQLLQVEDEVNSPTFNIINEYRCGSGEPIYHFDFYRIESTKEAMDIGVEEYLYSGAMCLIEWPQKIEQLLPPEAIKIYISVLEDGTRVISNKEQRA